MRGILVLVLLIVVMALLGWITWTGNQNRASINVETQEIRKDTEQAIESGRQFIENLNQQTEPSGQP